MEKVKKWIPRYVRLSTAGTQVKAKKQMDNRQVEMMTTIPEGRLLRKFIPSAMLAMSGNAIFNICEMLIIGYGVGLDAIAAFACMFPIIILVSGIAALVNSGYVSQLAVLLTDNEQEKALKVFGNAFVMMLISGLIITIVFEIFLEDMLRLCGASDVTLPYALDYMRIMLISTILLFTMQGMGRLLHIIGRPRAQIVVQIGGITMNVILGILFVLVFHWGMKGAAIASLICELSSWLIFLILLSDRRGFVHFTRRGLRVDKKIVMNLLSMGVSPFAINACGCIVALMINLSLLGIAGEQGDMYLGTYTIVQRITQILVSLVTGLGLGVQIITNVNITRRNYIRVRALLMHAIFYSFVIMSVGYGIIALFSNQLMAFFTSDSQMIAIGATALVIGLCTFPFVGSQMFAVSFFQAIRRPRTSMIISLTRQLLFLIPMLIILPHLIGVTGVWWSMALADVASVTISWIMLYTETKKLSL